MNGNPDTGYSSNSNTSFSFGPREERSSSLVLICGLGTTALTLLGVYLLDRGSADFNIMGWYANYVLPVGAIIVGLAAGSGYGLASWFSGLKITRGLLWILVATQLIAYFAAQYIAFRGLHLAHRANGSPVGFLEYYDLVARAFAWQDHDGKPGQPLGAWGYFFRALEVAGFVLGGLIVPLALRKAPYCPACQLYMKTSQIGLIPASVLTRKVKKSDAAGLAAYETEQHQAFDSARQLLDVLQQSVAKNDSAIFKQRLEELKPGKKAALKLPSRLSLHVIHCKRCFSGQFVTKLLVGQGKQLKQSEFARADLHPEFVRSVVQ
jgi:hypothetical protein